MLSIVASRRIELGLRGWMVISANELVDCSPACKTDVTTPCKAVSANVPRLALRRSGLPLQNVVLLETPAARSRLWSHCISRFRSKGIAFTCKRLS